MALQDTLPADWGTKSAAEKVEFFNTAGVTPSQLAAAGVPASDINWMQTVGGYKVADTPTFTPTATVEPAPAPVSTAYTPEPSPEPIAATINPVPMPTGLPPPAELPAPTGALPVASAQVETINIPASGALSTVPSTAYTAATSTGGIGLDKMNQNILEFLATEPTQSELQSAMNKWGVSQADIDRAKASVSVESAPTIASVNDKLKQELVDQAKKYGITDAWASAPGGAEESLSSYADYLRQQGIKSLSDIEVVQREPDIQYDEFGNAYDASGGPYMINKNTGDIVGQFGQGGNLIYNTQFANGVPVFYPTARQSDWVSFREGFLKPVISIAAGPLGYGAEVAAANAIYSASKGDWDKAILSAISASAPIAQGMGLDASTVDSLKTAQKAATVLKTLQDKNLLGLATSGADLAGISSIAGLDVKDVTSAIKLGSAILNADKNPGGLVNAMISYVGSQKPAGSGITNRVYDDTIVQAGADAFMKAKSAGASDEDAYAAAEAVTSAFTTPVTGGDTSKPVITDITSDQGEFAGLDEAIQKNAMDDAVRADKLDQIKNQPNFNDAYAQARKLLGANQTFEWNGKQYSTATFAEKPELSGAAVPGAASTTAGGGRGSYAGYSSVEDAASKAKIPTAKAAELLDYITTDQGAQYDAMGNLISGSVGVPDLNTTSGKIANGIGNALNTFFGVVANTPVAAVQAGGNLLSNAGGIVDLAAGRSTDIGNKLRSLGDQVDTFSASISDPKIKTQQQEIGKSVSDADGLWNKTKALASAAVDNPLGAANWVFTEAFEEVPGVGLALKSGSKLAAYGITLANDMMESGGSAYNDTYKQAIKTMSEEDARTAARNASLASMVATGVTQGLVEGKLVGKMLGKETAGEFAEGSAQAAATQLALGQELNINNILTQGVIEAAIGKGASTTAEAVTTTNAVNNINTEVSSAVASGDPVAVSAAITNSIKTGISEGADPSAVISIATSTALANGADVDSTVNSVVSASINEEASNADAVADSVINAATLAGADVNAIAGALTNSLIQAGVSADVAPIIVSNAALNATTGAGTSLASDVGATAGPSVTQSTAGTGASTGATTGTGAVTGTGAGTGTGATTGGDTTAGTGATTGTGVITGTTSGTGTTTGTGVTTGTGTTTGTGATTGTGVTTGTTTGTGATTETGVTTGTQTTAGTGATTGAGVTTSTSVDANTGATTTTATDANTNTKTTTQTDASGNVTSQTTVDNNTGVTNSVSIDVNTNTQITTQVDSNSGITNQVAVSPDSTVQTSIDANSGVNTQFTVDNNTGVTTNVTVDTNNNVSTETVTDPNTNTETTVRTDVNTNTQTTVVVNTQTGDIVDYVETTVPPTYTPPVIKVEDTTPTETPPTPTTPSTPATTTAAPKTAPKGTSSADALMASIAASAPMGLSLTPQYLKSTVTGGAIDPLAAVKQAQQEMERDAIMQQIDPRLAQILMDRMGIQPQGGQMGAYGEASNEPSQNYYTYGQEDSIDDILGGKAANFKEGGYVAPLMATGGMALPLLAKSGGALSHYNGREDFKHGKHVAGEGDGQSDDIPAWLADGEFVFPADVVSALGNGSTKAGTDKLYEMMHNIRDRARSTGKKDLPPPALKSALDYLKSSKRS